MHHPPRRDSRPAALVPPRCPWMRSASLLIVLALLAFGGSARALPVYARQYHVACSLCHSVPPRLNAIGYAFQANFFNMPGTKPAPRQKLGTYVPFSTVLTGSYSNDITGRQDTTDFRTLELFFSSGLGIGPARQGGFYVDLTAIAKGDAVAGDLDDAYVSLPLAGSRGQL